MATEDTQYWICGCPKPQACNNSRSYIQITLKQPLHTIPIVGSKITESGDAIGEFLASDPKGQTLWIKVTTGTFSISGNITTING